MNLTVRVNAKGGYFKWTDIDKTQTNKQKIELLDHIRQKYTV